VNETGQFDVSAARQWSALLLHLQRPGTDQQQRRCVMALTVQLELTFSRSLRSAQNLKPKQRHNPGQQTAVSTAAPASGQDIGVRRGTNHRSSLKASAQPPPSLNTSAPRNDAQQPQWPGQ
jgi:hypothetical protein